MRQPLGHRSVPPCQIRGLRGCLSLDRISYFQEPVGRVGPAVEHDILSPLEQIRGNVEIDRQLARVDYPHVHTGLDGVIQKHGMDGLSNRIVAAEGERDIADAAAHENMRQGLLDSPGRLDVIHRVIVVLLNPRRDRKDVRVEYDVLGREAHLFREDPIGPLADLDLSISRIGLSLLVERHHDDSRSVAPDQGSVPYKGFLTLLQTDRIDDALSLDTLEPGLYYRPLGRVDHHREPADVWL